MSAATPRSEPAALANPATPGPVLWNVTSRVSPDPIPRARQARATPAHAAHTVLAYALLHLACSTTSTLHNSTAPHVHAVKRSARNRSSAARGAGTQGSVSPCACTCGCRVQGGEARGAPWRASRMANGPWHGSLLPSGFGTVLLSLIFNIKRA